LQKGDFGVQQIIDGLSLDFRAVLVSLTF